MHGVVVSVRSRARMSSLPSNPPTMPSFAAVELSATFMWRPHPQYRNPQHRPLIASTLHTLFCKRLGGNCTQNYGFALEFDSLVIH